jgi:hypothetical protein
MSKKHDPNESKNTSSSQAEGLKNYPEGFKAPKNFELLPENLQAELLENWKTAQAEINGYKELVQAEQAKVKEQAEIMKAEEKAEKEKIRIQKTAERTARKAKEQALKAVDRMKETVENMKVKFSVPDIFAKKIQVTASKQAGSDEPKFGIITGMTRGADSQVFYRIVYLTSDGLLAGFHKKFAGITVLENNPDCQAVYEKIHSAK